MEVRGFFITSAFPLYGSRSQPKGTLRAATTPHAVPVSEAKATSSHRPRSVDRELEHLTNILELTADPRKQIRPLLKKHHDRIQALLDKNPTVSREALESQIHAISGETHYAIEALLTEYQKQLAESMQKRMRHREESKRPVPSNNPNEVRAPRTKRKTDEQDLRKCQPSNDLESEGLEKVSAIFQAEFIEYVANVKFCGAFRDLQGAGDFLVSEPPEQKLQHLAFTGRQRMTWKELLVEQGLHLLDKG